MLRHAAADQSADDAEADEQGERNAAQQHRYLLVFAFDVVDVDARAEHPVPRPKQGGVRELRFGDLLPGAREPVFDEATTRLRGRDQVTDERFAVGVLEVELVLAFHGGIAAIDEIDAVGVDTEIVVTARIAQTAQRIAGSLLGIGLAQLAVGRQLVMMRDDADANLDHVADLFLAILEHGIAQLEQGIDAEHQQADQGEADEKLHAGGQFESG